MRRCHCCGLELPHKPEEARLCPAMRIINRFNRAGEVWGREMEAWEARSDAAIARGEEPREKPPRLRDYLGYDDDDEEE